jgi:hypothetical protein
MYRGAPEPFNGMGHSYNPYATFNAEMMAAGHGQSYAEEPSEPQQSHTGEVAYGINGMSNGHSNAPQQEFQEYHEEEDEAGPSHSHEVNVGRSDDQQLANTPSHYTGYQQPLPPSGYVMSQQPNVYSNVAVMQQQQLWLQQQQHPNVVLHFQNIGEVQNDDNRILFTCPSPDYSIPKTNSEQRMLVGRLAAAIRNNQDASEEPTKGSFVNRWADGATFYSSQDIEKVAWELVEGTIKLHLFGWNTRDARIRDDKLIKKSRKTGGVEFFERFDAIERLLMVSVLRPFL